MKNKKVILACIILLVILLVVIGVVLYTSPYNKALRKIKEINATTKIEEANVYTVDIYKLFNIYKGDLTSEVISKTYENFAVNIIPRYYKACSGLDENGINKYYKGNKNTIRVELGIQNEEDFQKFIQYLNSNISDSNLIFKSTRAVGESIKGYKDYIEMYVEVNYENGTNLVFNTHISKVITTDITPITYSIDVNNEILEKEAQKRQETEEMLEKANEANNDPNAPQRGHGVPIDLTKQ